MRAIVRHLARAGLLCVFGLEASATPPEEAAVLYEPVAVMDGPSGGCCGEHSVGMLRQPLRSRWIGSTCTMGQRPLDGAYFPGNYYFHPYHHSHVPGHQAFGQRWGEPSETPYANLIFQRVYRQYLADASGD